MTGQTLRFGHCLEVVSWRKLGATFTQGMQGPAVDRLWWLRNQTGSFLLFLTLYLPANVPAYTFLPSCLPPTFPLFIFLFVSQINKQLAKVMAPQLDQFNNASAYFRPKVWVTFLVGNVHLIIPEANAIHNHLLFLCIPTLPLLLSPTIPFPPLSQWVTEAGCILSHLTRFLNPSLGEPSCAKHAKKISVWFLSFFPLKLCLPLWTPPLWWELSFLWWMHTHTHTSRHYYCEEMKKYISQT